ncbi:MAG TPA: AgmX/PglI C-terminal domain-containing protein [Steroidobacteraceae bacterium]
MLRPYYRTYDLPWNGDEEADNAFRKLWRGLLIAVILLGLITVFISVPERPANVKPEMPARLAKIIIEREAPPPPPPPPPPVQEDKPKPVEPEKKVAMVKPPEDRQTRARQRAQAQLAQVQDQLADLRQAFDTTPLQTKNLSGAVGAASTAERSLITSRVGASSGGITSAPGSRGFGGGAGSLSGHETTAVTSSIARSGLNTREPTRSGSSGKASRSREEIEMVFDRHKGAIYALYSRALRSRPELQGKIVLEFTIAPSGEVTMCRVVSSELDDPELQEKIVQRVKGFRFEARDVEPITTTKPIEFFPA